MFHYKEVKNMTINSAAHGTAVNIVGVGDMKVSQMINGKETTITLLNVGYSPDIRTNLIALGKLQNAGFTVNFPPKSNTMLVTHGKKPVLRGTKKHLSLIHI